MTEFVKKYWVLLLNILILFVVIGRLSVTTEPVTILFVYIGTYIVSFLTALKLAKRKDEKDIAF